MKSIFLAKREDGLFELSFKRKIIENYLKCERDREREREKEEEEASQGSFNDSELLKEA